jgi:hypothetical protein
VAVLKTFDETSLVPLLDELSIAKVHEKILLEKEEAEQKRVAREQARAAYNLAPSSATDDAAATSTTKTDAKEQAELV